LACVIGLIRSTAVRSQQLYPKRHENAKCKSEVIGSVELEDTQKSRTQKERIKEFRYAKFKRVLPEIIKKSAAFKCS